MKRTSGITLIALIITIIVLLILAGVALATLTGQGNIIGNAENAVGKYNNSVAREQQLLNEIEKYFIEYTSGGTIQDTNPPIVEATEGIETIVYGADNEISKYFTYTANGTAEITSVVYTDTSDENKVVTNTSTLAVGTHLIKCTVIKETGITAEAIKTIVIESFDPTPPETALIELQLPMVDSDNICPKSFKLKATGNDKDSGISSYKFYIDGTLYSTQETTEKTCIIEVLGREEETTYSCYVEVINGGGISTRSEEIEVRTISSIATIDKINRYPKGYYGKEVIYSPINESTNEWKIFYADEENVYLIASKYLNSSYAPNAYNGTQINRTSYSNEVFFTNIVNDTSETAYLGTENILQGDQRVHKWINYVKKFTSTNQNMKATAYLLDTRIWDNFKNENGEAEYIIGSPTLELFIASYNDTHPENTLGYEIADDKGYKLDDQASSTSNEPYSWGKRDEKLYVCTKDGSTGSAYEGVWLASPVYNTTDSLFYIYHYSARLNVEDVHDKCGAWASGQRNSPNSLLISINKFGYKRG